MNGMLAGDALSVTVIIGCGLCLLNHLSGSECPPKTFTLADLPPGWTVERSNHGEYKAIDPNGFGVAVHPTLGEAVDWARRYEASMEKYRTTTWEVVR